MVSLRPGVARRDRGLALGLGWGVAWLGWLGVGAGEVEGVLQGWLARQAGWRTWTAECVQTRTVPTLVQPLVTTGRVWYAAPDRFRWELGQPAQTIAVRAGDGLTLVYPRLRRAERYPLGEGAPGAWRETLALLEAGFPRDRAQLERQFRLLTMAETNGVWTLAWQPVSVAARRFITEVRVGLATNDYGLRATELVFADGSRMHNEFRGARADLPVEPERFRAPVGADYTVTEPLQR